MKKRMITTLAFVASSLLLNADLRADDAGDTAKPDSSVPHESAASFDKRLPPVLPGEEITKDGKTMKVWSSSGPVVVADAPEPWRTPAQQLPSGIGVIVDQRDSKKSH